MLSAARFACRDILDVAADPIKRIEAAFGARPEGRVRPLRRRRNEAVLDGIEMDVIHVRGTVRVVADGVLPKAALPDAAFAVGLPDARSQLRIRQGAGEESLDQAPGGGEIVIAVRPRLYRVKMIREDDPGIHGEGSRGSNTPHRAAKELDPVDEQRVAAPLH
jgi:hypothetical protein